ncbi:hypothetical protein BABINDRAFT_179166 [Babjeviella inositovora NRRL Y-12698]|uniref:Inositol-1-monophosphatase n=1 Tax=Babjeviella inositovora NRRL Y-12698 TaxID=984486 RepID=A0A1E3R040_9ASCO|nr:uncharacterized protein BABINDRAFT_179166 [Babjeviella inositovora NRRL Y-12698]ODQ83259.1 hypothetical protein BABINDRAFT_179166 [Babjeviella inositovora NRRL Y-12698]
MELDLKEIHDFAVGVAEAAGKVLLTRSSLVKNKANSVDLVTEVDEKVEAIIKKEIALRYPEHNFLGEETYSAGSLRVYAIGDEPTWCVDPIDGTVNYVHLFPMICVSIGFTYQGKSVVGAIHAPYLNQTFSAYQGGGAWVNRTTRLPYQNHPLAADAPRGCVFACEWGKDRRDEPNSNLSRKVDSFVNMATEIGGRNGMGGMVHGIRSLGSAALDLCYVATGAFDIWWEGGCWEWDVCAGVIIVQEAGGLVTTANPPDSTESPVPDVGLGSRLYLAIRPAVATESESSRDAQERVVREVWKRVRALDYSRPTE